MLLANLSCCKFEIIQLPREKSVPTSTIIRYMGIGRIFTRSPLADFF